MNTIHTTSAAARYGRSLAAGLLLLGVVGCVAPAYRDLGGAVPSRPASRPPVPPASNGSLTLSAAIQQAWATDERIAVLNAALDVAKERRQAAADLTDPELRLAYRAPTGDSVSKDSGTDMDTAGTGSRISAGLRLEPPQPWSRAARISAGIANSNAARLDMQAVRWQVAMEVARTVTDIRYFNDDADLLEKLVAVHDDTLKLYREKEKERYASLPDILLASQQRLKALAERDRVSRKLSESWRRLREIAHLPSGQITISPPRAVPSGETLTALTLEQLKRKIVENRADLAALLWRELAAKSVYDEARASRILWPGFVQLSYSLGDQSQNSGNVESFSSNTGTGDPEWRVDVGVSLPLFSWANHAVPLRFAEYRQAEAVYAEAVKSANLALQSAWDAMRSLQKSQASFATEAEPVVTDTKALLESVGKESGLSPEQAARIREQYLILQRLELEREYEFQMGVIAVEETVGTWLIPVESR